jgi:hypothetical protein
MEPSSRVSAIESKRSNSTSFLTNLIGTMIALLTLGIPLWAVAYFSSDRSPNRQPNWQMPAALHPLKR